MEKRGHFCFAFTLFIVPRLVGNARHAEALGEDLRHEFEPRLGRRGAFFGIGPAGGVALPDIVAEFVIVPDGHERKQRAGLLKVRILQIVPVDSPVSGQVQVEVLRIGRAVAAARPWAAHSHTRHAHSRRRSSRPIIRIAVGETWGIKRFVGICRQTVYVISQMQYQVDAAVRACRLFIADQPLIDAVFVGRPALARHEGDIDRPPGIQRRRRPGTAQAAAGAVGGDEPVVVGGIRLQVADQDAQRVVVVGRGFQRFLQQQVREFRGAADLDRHFGVGLVGERVHPAPQQDRVGLRIRRSDALREGVAGRCDRVHRRGEALPGRRQHETGRQRARRVLEKVPSLRGHDSGPFRRSARRAGRAIAAARRRGSGSCPARPVRG